MTLQRAAERCERGGHPGSYRPPAAHAVGEVPMGVVPPVPGPAEKQLQGGAFVSRHRPAR